MDAVERQVEAYNAGDLEGFVSCYAQGVVIEDAKGEIGLRGRDEIRKLYEELFASAPNLRAEIVSRIRVGPYVVDEERVSGMPDGADLHVAAVYRIDAEGLIDQVRFLR